MLIKSILAAVTASLLATSAYAAPVFNRVASFPVALNNAEAEATSAEIIAASDDGMTLVYSDSPAGGIGFVDITDAKAPKAAGFLSLDGEPTSVTIIGGKVYAAVNTSESFAAPSGKLVVVDLATKAIETTVDLGGQPDSITHNAAGDLIAIAIENERDEEVNDGDLPQMPAGYVVLLNLKDGALDAASLKKVDVTGLSEVAGDDPEPEFVVDQRPRRSGADAAGKQRDRHHRRQDRHGDRQHFSAGTVTLEGIDTKKDGALKFTGKMEDVAREPDAVKWLDDNRLVVANEGDWKGGSRSFTIFNKDGTVAYESGAKLELEAARMGHYPDGRNKKGVEPEGLETAHHRRAPSYFFVAEERSSLIAVLKDTGAEPEYLQSLPSGISPEGLVAIPSRNLLATANELDLGADGGSPARMS